MPWDTGNGMAEGGSTESSGSRCMEVPYLKLNSVCVYAWWWWGGRGAAQGCRGVHIGWERLQSNRVWGTFYLGNGGLSKSELAWP